MHKLFRLAAALAAPLALAHCGNSLAPASNAVVVPGAGSGLKYDATVTRTEMGIPHVKASRDSDFGSVGYGLGYAFAEDNLCVLLDDLVTIRGQRSEFFGPTGTYTIHANNAVANNVDSDFFWKLMATDAAIAPFKTKIAPEARAATTGFKDGFNRYLAEANQGLYPGRHAECAGKPWTTAISEDDMYRRYYRLAILASSSVFVREIGTAAPPVSTGRAKAAPKLTPTQIARVDRSVFPFTRELPIGSNMVAIGPDFSENGQSIQFVNPHFPWIGTERLYMSHLTVPGRMDIMGSSLYGVPAILIGFNDHLAWSHTVSSAYRFSFYELTLTPGDPTSYVYNGATVKMTAVPLTIRVKQTDGSLAEQSRTLYKSQYGPMLTFSVSGVNVLPWSTSKAYTLRDANAENDRLINQFFAWNTAKNLTEFKALHKSILGVPWVNTIATGPGELAYYGDVTVVPNVPDALVRQCSTSAQAQAFAQLAPGLPLLDGSMVACQWQTDADAPAPGIFGPSHLPTLERRDWVGNNDSYWLTNPAEPVTGFAKIIGAENSTRSLRTRLGIIKMLERAAGSDGKPGNKWNVEQLKDSVLDSRIYSADIARDAVISGICNTPNLISTSGAAVNVSEACAVLAAWDKTNNLDSVGGHIWREFWVLASGATGFYTTPFSAADPVNTPRAINTNSPQVKAAFAQAVKNVTDMGFAMDAPMRAIQHSGVNGVDIPVFGGIGNTEGAFTIASARSALTKSGYNIIYGNSHVEVATWDANGVVAEGFITYSQSTDPTSPHYSDFTRNYAQKKWQRLPFHAAEIAAQKIGEKRLVE